MNLLMSISFNDDRNYKNIGMMIATSIVDLKVELFLYKFSNSKNRKIDRLNQLQTININQLAESIRKQKAKTQQIKNLAKSFH